MIFGSKKARPEGDRNAWKKQWHRAYAWRPVQLLDGRWVWLEPVKRISWWAREIEPRDIHTCIGDWSFRLPAAPSLSREEGEGRC